MEIGCSTWSLGPKMGLGEKLTLIKKAGFELIEAGPGEPPDFPVDGDRNWMKRSFEKNGLSLYSYHSVCCFYYPKIGEAASFLNREMELASYLGAKIMVIHEIEVENGYAIGYVQKNDGWHSPVRGFKVKELTDEEASKNLTRTFLENALPLAEKHAVVLTLENAAILGLESIYSLLEGFHSASLGFTLDTQHAFIHSRDLLHQWIYRLKDYLYHVHVGDANSNDGHRLIGSLMIDWKELRGALLDVGFSGCLMVEVQEGGNLYPEDLLYEGVAKSREYLLKLLSSNAD